MHGRVVNSVMIYGAFIIIVALLSGSALTQHSHSELEYISYDGQINTMKSRQKREKIAARCFMPVLVQKIQPRNDSTKTAVETSIPVVGSLISAFEKQNQERTVKNEFEPNNQAEEVKSNISIKPDVLYIIKASYPKTDADTSFHSPKDSIQCAKPIENILKATEFENEKLKVKESMKRENDEAVSKNDHKQTTDSKNRVQAPKISQVNNLEGTKQTVERNIKINTEKQLQKPKSQMTVDKIASDQNKVTPIISGTPIKMDNTVKPTINLGCKLKENVTLQMLESNTTAINTNNKMENNLLNLMSHKYLSNLKSEHKNQLIDSEIGQILKANSDETIIINKSSYEEIHEIPITNNFIPTYYTTPKADKIYSPFACQYSSELPNFWLKQNPYSCNSYNTNPFKYWGEIYPQKAIQNCDSNKEKHTFINSDACSSDEEYKNTNCNAKVKSKWKYTEITIKKCRNGSKSEHNR